MRLGGDVFKIRIKLEMAELRMKGKWFGFKTTKNFPIVTLGRILTTLVSAVFMRPEIAGISSPEAVPDAVERPGKLCLGPLRRDW